MNKIISISAEERLMLPVTSKIPAELHAELLLSCHELAISPSAWIRQAIQARLDDFKIVDASYKVEMAAARMVDAAQALDERLEQIFNFMQSESSGNV